MKLELKHLAPYLPYGLKYKKQGNDIDIFELIGLSERTRSSIGEWRTYNRHQFSSNPINAIPIKPILRPLSDLMIGVDFNELEVLELQTKGMWSSFTITQWERVYRNHFDVFGLIEQNLAIDINKVGGL